MISVSRKYLRSLRSVFRRLAGNAMMRSARVTFSAGSSGQSIRCRADDIAIEHRRPGAQPPAELMIPFRTLAELEGAKDDPVFLKPDDSGAVIAEWIEAGVPQQRRAACLPAPDHSALPMPETLTPVGTEFAAAFAEATKSVADGPTRYALQCVALRGKAGQIAATDGKQLFLAEGFAWPWDSDLLTPATGVFAAKELADVAWSVGRTEEHVVLSAGDWTIWLPIDKDSKFPDVDHLIPAANTAVMSAELATADAAFLTETLPRLPGKESEYSPVTVHCNGHVAVRAQAGDGGPVTELLLSQSTNHGEELAFAVNRDYLSRAVALGCHRFLAWKPDKPILALGPNRQFFWQPLASSVRVSPTLDAVQIASPAASKSSARTTETNAPTPITLSPVDRIIKKERIPTQMQSATASTNAHTDFKPINRITAENLGHDVPANPTGGPITQAEALKANLRAALSNVNELLVALKRQRKQSQLVKSTLESLKCLERVA